MRKILVTTGCRKYIPQAPVSDEAKKHNQNLPGMGDVFNAVNLSLYHYAANNPVKYTDPDGRCPFLVVTGIIGAGAGALYGAYKSYQETGSVDWKVVGKDALIGGAIGVGAGAALSLGATALVGSATATASSYEIAATLTTFVSTNPAVGNVCANLGRKLDYIFGKAQGEKHNIDRSLSMQRSLENIGLSDSAQSRAYITEHRIRFVRKPQILMTAVSEQQLRYFNVSNTMFAMKIKASTHVTVGISRVFFATTLHST